MAASAVRGSVRGMVRRLSQFGRSPKVSPDYRPQPLIQGKKLTERIWLPDLKAETLDVNSSQLQNLARQVTVAIGAECRLVCNAHVVIERRALSSARTRQGRYPDWNVRSGEQQRWDPASTYLRPSGARVRSAGHPAVHR